MSKKSLKNKMIDYIFTVSKQPVRYKDLLAANAFYNEGMYVDPAKLNFRMNITKAYFIYALICACILLPFIALIHLMPSVNNHIPILGVIFATSCVFISFNYFTVWLRDNITLRLIKEAWLVHFPYFPYDKYNKKIEELYHEIRKKELPRKDWEQYILNGLLN
ncbi:MAG: hypothetical protein LBL65_02110 [Campylobacteraceae bacterium]|jgi:hypothetical protein|nr:hypothetical protein [Campylobacteraceae bacterium]